MSGTKPTGALDDLETLFQREFGREMSPEERELFQLAQSVAPFDPQDEQEIAELGRALARRRKLLEAEIQERDAA
jgi:predicted nucleic acid-binding protein